MAFATLRGLEFYYELIGSGERLLFLNGTGGDLRQQPRLFDGPLTKELQVLAHDQRGLGQSAKPDVPYTMGDYPDDAAELLDFMGWDRVHVLGVSFGGMVAQEFAIRHPDRLDRLVLACTSSGGEGRSSYPLHELAELGPDKYLAGIMSISDTRWNQSEEADESGAGPSRFEKIFEFMKERRALPDDGEDPETKEIGSRRQLEARMGHDTWDRLTEIEAPTLLCGGRYDGIAEPQNMKNLASRIPNSKLEFFEGGHGFLLDDRAAFSAILDFLR